MRVTPGPITSTCAPEWDFSKCYRYEIEGETVSIFDCEETAMAFFERDRTYCEKLAKADGESFKRQVRNDRDGQILISETVLFLEEQAS